MAYVNVREWSPDQVTEWLRGLDNVILPYINSFLNNEVKGHQLLSLRSDDLEHLGVYTLGHQELILEAVDHLRNFHYELDRENLQLLALRLSCASHSLYKELLSSEDASKVETQTMSDVANIITTIKPLVCWLDRAPFSGQGEYLDRKSKLLQLSLEMATCAHRDRFTEQPVDAIRTGCKALARLADNIIQEISDPMLLQPASLDLATLKKKENELGFSLMPSYHGIHQIAEIKFTSPAHTSSKLEEGDEIVQVNYQTVVGWQRKKVLGLFQESPPDIVLTLKKRPRHTKVYGQIYMKPYRLPSKKRATPYSRWNDNLPSPRPEFLTIPDFEMPLPRLPPVTQPQPLESESSSDSEPPDSPLESQGRVYPLKPRPVLQRRNTITGASPTSKRPHQAIEQYWNELKHQASYKHSSSTYIETDNYKHDSVYLRDKSASCGHGLELATQRPATYPKKFDKSLLITSDASDSKTDGKKRVNFEDRKLVFEETSSLATKNESIKKPPELTSIKEVTCSTSDINSLLKESNFSAINLNNSDTQQNLEKSISVNSITSLSHSEEQIKYIDDIVDEINDRSQMNAEWKDEIIEELIGSLKKSCVSIPEKLGNTLPATTQEKNLPDKSLTMLETPKPIEKPLVLPLAPPRNQFGDVKITKKPPEIPAKPDVSKKPAVPPRSFTTRVTRGRLDKSHSTPAYDTTEDKITDNNRTPDIFISPPEIPESPVSKEPISTEAVENKTQENENTSEPSQPPSINTPLIDSRREIKIDETARKFSEPDLIKLPHKLSDTPPEPPPRTIYGNFTDTPPSSVNKPKYFEPKTVSTPINKTAPILDFPDVPNKSSYVTEMPKSETKISPTNSVVRNMMNRNKTVKKKNNLIAKRRKVTVKDLTPCDIQGYLYQRLRNKHTQNFHWEKRWFVLLGSCLYGFKTKEALKAECLIFLTGFTVATAHEVKSRLHAFKVYHTGTAFYFSADNSETMTSWVELITAATLHSDGTKPPENVLFSETDDSESEKPKAEGKEKSETSRKFGSLKKFTSKKISTESTTSHNESTSLDRKYLRFFNNSSSKTPKNQLPVPTPQFRSYRKVVPPNLVINTPVTTPKRIEVVVTKPTDIPITELETKDEASNSSGSSKSKLKPKPINYIHASNPSLCDLNDHRLQSFYQKSRQFTQRTENLAGFVTLEQFMLNRQEEERRQNVLFGLNENIQINPNTIQPDVVYGEVRMPYSGDSRTFDSKRKDSAPKTEHRKQLSDPQSLKTEPKKLTHARTNSDGYTDLYYEKHSIKTDSKTLPKSDKSMFENQSRSLPRSPEIRRDLISPYEDSQLISDAKLSEPYELQYADKKSLRMQKIGNDRAYELIYCPQKVNDVQFAQNRTLDGQKKLPDVSRTKPSKLLTRQHSLNSADKLDSKIFLRGESPEKFWLDSLRRSDKVTDKCTSKIKLKSATQYTPMCLPLTPDQKGKLNPKFAFELNLDDKSNSSKGGKFKSLFGKPSDEKKEKTLLGSPRLHRAFFRKQNNSEGDWSSEAPQVVPFSTNLTPPRSGGLTNSSPSSSVVMSPPPDYPGLEYPPVFEPETYSLANPSCSLTLLRKQQQQQQK